MRVSSPALCWDIWLLGCVVSSTFDQTSAIFTQISFLPPVPTLSALDSVTFAGLLHTYAHMQTFLTRPVNLTVVRKPYAFGRNTSNFEF